MGMIFPMFAVICKCKLCLHVIFLKRFFIQTFYKVCTDLLNFIVFKNSLKAHSKMGVPFAIHCMDYHSKKMLLEHAFMLAPFMDGFLNYFYFLPKNAHCFRTFHVKFNVILSSSFHFTKV